MKLQFGICALMLVVASGFGAEQAPLSWAETRGLKLRDDTRAGVRVFGVEPGSPGANAGILVQDVITAVDGKPVSGLSECFKAIWEGTTVRKDRQVLLTIDRGGQTVSATLQPLLTYDSEFQPTPPVPFPSAYKDYQILPGAISPDARYAFIYPKRLRLYELKKYGLFLAALKPFRILSQLPLGNSNLAGNARCYYAATWAKDVSAAVFIAGSRWGPERVSVVQLRHGKVTQQTELTSAVHKRVQADFKKSHAEPYNGYYDFVFDSEERQTVIDGETLAELGWDLDEAGHVIIDCNCTTDPKQINPRRWTVRFKGLWDIRSGSFVKEELRRIPVTHN